MEIVCVLCEVENEISYLFEMFHSRAMIHAVDRHLSSLRSGFNPRELRVRFLVDKVAKGQTSPSTWIFPR
jgi:hypothetical protein